MREFFDSRPRIRAGFLVVLIAFCLFAIPRAFAFGEYFSAIVLTVCLPAPVWRLVLLARSGALREGARD